MPNEIKNNEEKIREQIFKKINGIRDWSPHYRVQSSLVPKKKEDSYLMSDRIIQYLYIRFSKISTAGNIPYFTLEYTEQETFLMEETDKNVPSMKLSYCLVENDIKKDEKEIIIEDNVLIGSNEDERLNLIKLPKIPASACRLIQKGPRSSIWFLCAEQIGERLYIEKGVHQKNQRAYLCCPMRMPFRTGEITSLDCFYIWVNEHQKYEFRIKRAHHE